MIATRYSIGNLYQQYVDTIAFITSRLNTSFTIVGTGSRLEQLEILLEAIREIVINAIVHRNYLINGPSKISIYDDRIDIFSLGNFPDPIIDDKVDIGVTYIRNKIITRVFREIGVIEKLRSGFITLFEDYAKRKLPKPIVSEGIGFVKCQLLRPSLHAKNRPGSDLHLIEPLLLKKNKIGTHDVAEFLSISRTTASRMLSKLVATGCLRKIGNGSSTRYLLG